MRKALLLAISILLIASTAIADHIGIYRDSSGQSCRLDPGYSTNGTIIHKFSLGATGSTFRVDLSHAPGSTFIAFHSPFVPIGDLPTGISIGYGGRCTTGNIVVGTIEAMLSPGYLEVAPKIGFTVIEYTDCAGMYSATGGRAFIGDDGDCVTVATEQSTWGHVKALYR